jgi:hypothetical protein
MQVSTHSDTSFVAPSRGATDSRSDTPVRAVADRIDPDVTATGLSPANVAEVLETLSAHRAALHLVLEAQRLGVVRIPESLVRTMAQVCEAVPPYLRA